MVTHKVAVIQLHTKVYLKLSSRRKFTDACKPLQVEDNHLRACKFIREAASQGAVLAVLPEQVSSNASSKSMLKMIQIPSHRLGASRPSLRYLCLGL
jgi:hypothetical protein